MTDELHFGLEEGERHPSDGREWRLIAASLERIETLLGIQNCLLYDLLVQTKPKTYPKPTGVQLSVE